MNEREKSKTALVIGAGGAIGGAITDRLSNLLPESQIIATHRQAVAGLEPRIQWHQLDLTHEEEIAAFVDGMINTLEHLDYLVCATGILHANGINPEKKAADWGTKQFQQVMWVNAGAPLTLLTGLTPLLKQSDAPRALFLSAQIGSIGDNGSGGWYSYRMSKAALNMGIKTAAIEASRWRNSASIVTAHPGTTRSGLSRPFTAKRKNLLDPASCAADLTELLLKLKPDQSGTFTDRLGNPLPW